MQEEEKEEREGRRRGSEQELLKLKQRSRTRLGGTAIGHSVEVSACCRVHFHVRELFLFLLPDADRGTQTVCPSDLHSVA